MIKTTNKAHPWHGIAPGSAELLTCFVEIVPTDTVKYEIDKMSGYLKIDRPQRYSNYCPALYGFVPQSYCGKRIGEYCAQKAKIRETIDGDGDPLDICILTEKAIPHGDILVQAIPIGGLRLIDNNQADDKIIAVLKNDAVYGEITNIEAAPKVLIDRLSHYFLTYKQMPDSAERKVKIVDIYSAAEAKEVINLSFKDYNELKSA